MKNIITLLFFSIFLISGHKSKEKKIKKPKIVIGIVVDQMRYDYLTRFYDRYSENGFKKLLNNGFSLENAHYNYIPTYTAVGHTSIYTGTTPENHGVISNYWYDKFLKKTIYCVDDITYKTVGNSSDSGKKSPYRMQSTTVADQLHMAQNMRGKTIGIGIKDRSAILPAGHTANAAYWFDGGTRGQWISSSYYMDKLPDWVIKFNNSNRINKYLEHSWSTLYDINTYTNSIADNNEFERKFAGETTSSFPHNIPQLKSTNGNFDILKSIPNGNTFTFDFAKSTITNENLGKNNDTDFLAISLSSTDYIGHQFGPMSIEIEDAYLRLDRDIANFISFLDKNIGENNYTIFLTSDHGAVDVPGYLKSIKIPTHFINSEKLKENINAITKKHFNSTELIENISNYQIFLNKGKIDSLGLNKNTITNKLVEEVININNIYKVISAKTLRTTHFTSGIMNSLQNGYNQKYSGDILMIPYPATSSWGKKGTSHGSGYSYDTHIPIIFYGNGIKKGLSKKRYNIIDIAPTIANLLQIEAPNAATGQIIEEALSY